jgi:DNA primase
MIPDALVEEVRARSDIVEIVGEQIPLKRAGREFKGLCPFHQEKTPSFYVVPAKGFYKCFGCGESGDIFAFLMKRSGMNFIDAVRLVAAKVGVEIPETTPGREYEDPNRTLYEAIAFAEDFFRSTLTTRPEGERALQYLAGRGLGGEAIERFRIGCAPDAWRALREAAHRMGIDDEVLLEAGLIKESERSDEPYDRFRDRVIFPIAEANDRTIGFGGRVLSKAENAPKYLNSPETPIHHKGRILYGLNWSKNAVRREGAVLVVEGYMDYVSLASRGVEHVVAAMGTALTPEQANLIARYAGKAYLLYDSDAAGLRATFRSADALLRSGVHPLVVTLPPGEDPDSLVREGGPDALRRRLDTAVDVLERKLQILDAHGFMDDIEGKRRALDRLLPTLRATVDPALRDLYVARVAERTGVRRETLEREASEERAPRESYDDRAMRPGTRRGPEPAWRETKPPLLAQQAEAERLVILLMARDATWIVPVMAALDTTEIRDPVNRELFEAFAGLPPLSTGADAIAAETLDATLSEPAKRLLDSLRKDPIEIADGDRTFRDVVADIKSGPLFLRLEDIDRKLGQAEEEEGPELMRERARVNRELSALGASGFKFSPRFRKYARAARARREPPTQEDG